jgi:hypothetical protein
VKKGTKGVKGKKKKKEEDGERGEDRAQPPTHQVSNDMMLRKHVGNYVRVDLFHSLSVSLSLSMWVTDNYHEDFGETAWQRGLWCCVQSDSHRAGAHCGRETALLTVRLFRNREDLTSSLSTTPSFSLSLFSLLMFLCVRLRPFFSLFV